MNLGSVALVALGVGASLTASAEPADGAGFTVAAGGGLNVGKPFAEARVGRRFARAIHFELFLDYSYDRAISEFPFHTIGFGVRTYLVTWGRFELFHQATAGFVISAGGDVHERTIGERLLGPMFTQGVGLAAALDPCWSAAVVVATGDPVWLRPELSVRYRF